MAAKKMGFVVGAIAGVGVAAAALAGAGMASPAAHAGDRAHLIQTSGPPIFAPPPGAPLSFADIFERVSPAVVSVNVTSKIDPKTLGKLPGFENFPFDIVPKGKGKGGDDDADPSQPSQAMSAGSGFFISADGYIVTNNHVVENATDIKVVLKDQRELSARVIGRDEGTDLAVIKVEGQGFPFVDFENAGKPRVGDWVIAVGNPFGLGGTATAGIVSAYGRDIGETFVDYIQIDAPINRGNSGGPTFDIYGRVIGVNTAIFSPSGGSVGIGFAIPSEIADSITKQLIAGGKITRGYLGATIQNVTPDIADSIGMSGRKGAMVAELIPGGPAQKAGVQPGDVVTSVNGAPVTNASELTRQVARAHAGDSLRLQILRNGQPREIEVRSGVRPSEAQLAAAGTDSNNDAGPGGSGSAANETTVLGLGLTPLDDTARRRFGITGDVKGALIDKVAGTSDAGKKGVKRGDVVVRAGDRAVSGPADVTAAVEAAKKAGRPSILVFIRREGHQLGVPLKIEK